MKDIDVFCSGDIQSIILCLINAKKNDGHILTTFDEYLFMTTRTLKVFQIDYITRSNILIFVIS